MGRQQLKQTRHRADFSPIEADCPCTTCRHFTRAYLHTLVSKEQVAPPPLASEHRRGGRRASRQSRGGRRSPASSRPVAGASSGRRADSDTDSDTDSDIDCKFAAAARVRIVSLSGRRAERAAQLLMYGPKKL